MCNMNRVIWVMDEVLFNKEGVDTKKIDEQIRLNESLNRGCVHKLSY